MAIKSSSELQSIVLSTIIKDTYIMTRVIKYIDEEFFNKYSYKVIFKSLKYYYNKYSKIPSLSELMVIMEEFHRPEFGSITDLKQECQSLYDTPRYDENFVIDKLTVFIKRNNVEKTLKQLLPRVTEGSEVAVESIGEQLAESLSFQIGKTNSFNLSDINELGNIRRSAIGSEDNPLIIKSCIDPINSCLQFKGYKPGDVIMICSPPGCFTGDTKVMTLDGSTHTFDELYKIKECKGIYGYDKGIDTGLYESVQLTKYADELVYVEIDGKYIIKCTPDHRFMLRDGSYKEAKDLTELDSLMPIRREYRTAQNNGSKLTSKSEGYECVVDGDNHYEYTHKLSARKIERLDESETHIHHSDLNKLNNLPSNLEWKTPRDHRSIHAHLNFDNNPNSIANRIKKGEHKSPSTEFTSEYISDRNKRNWCDSDYRDRMTGVISDNGKNSKLVNELNHSSEFQKNNRKCKVLSYINYMISKFGIDSIKIDNFDELSIKIEEMKQHVKLSGIAKAYDCIIDNGKPRRYADIDFDKLSNLWSSILSDAMAYNHKVTKIELIKLDKAVPVYDIVGSSVNSNFAIALNDEEGIFVHNCGKTMFMINEGSNAAIQGFNVLHLFLGDMKEYDGFIRYTSCLTGRLQDEIVSMSVDDQKELIRHYNFQGTFNRITVASYSAGEIDSKEMIQEVKRLQDENHVHFDLINIDYADNLAESSDNMYKNGGDIYNDISLLAGTNHSVVIVGSQPKTEFWDEEIIPKRGAAESAKKQHIIDVMITMNKFNKTANIGSIFLPKVRRGQEGKIIRWMSHYEKAKLEVIKEDEYLKEKATY